MNLPELSRIISPLDVGFTSGHNNPWTICNRATGAGLKNALNRKYPTHTFLFTLDQGQPFATELTEDGIEEDSAAQYLNDGKSGRLIAIYRWTGWTADTTEKALARLAQLRQLDLPYSLGEAVGKNPLVRKLFPRMTSRHRERETCDENVFTILTRYGGWKNYPELWIADSRNYHPWMLMQAMNKCDGFLPIWKAES
jgi:hypothetical protein